MLVTEPSIGTHPSADAAGLETLDAENKSLTAAGTVELGKSERV